MPVFVFIAALIGAIWLWFVYAGPFRGVDMDVAGPRLRPALSQIASAEEWRAGRAGLLAALDANIYGPTPAPIAPVVEKEPIAPAQAGGVRGVEQWRVDLGAAGAFHIVLVRPPGMAPAPTIVMQNFCGNQAAFPGRPRAIAKPLQYYPWICSEAGFDPSLRAIFGAYINGPPFELIAARGYAIALVYAGDVVPDRNVDARAAMARFAPPETGAISAWAWVHSRTLDALEQDGRLDPSRFVVWGQSRNGKAALLAGARDERFAAVVALQSGRGGDAPVQHRVGESVHAVNMQFRHWFAPRFRAYERADPPVDAHQLLALIAPRPLLIGHARRDGWADPIGARAAVDEAREIYDLLDAPAPRFFVREGRHGIYREDWEETLDFLDARLGRAN